MWTRKEMKKHLKCGPEESQRRILNTSDPIAGAVGVRVTPHLSSAPVLRFTLSPPPLSLPRIRSLLSSYSVALSLSRSLCSSLFLSIVSSRSILSSALPPSLAVLSLAVLSLSVSLSRYFSLSRVLLQRGDLDRQTGDRP